MSVAAEKAISFECDKCGLWQCHDYTLEGGWFEDREIMEGRIECERCGYENHVVEEILKKENHSMDVPDMIMGFCKIKHGDNEDFLGYEINGIEVDIYFKNRSGKEYIRVYTLWDVVAAFLTPKNP